MSDLEKLLLSDIFRKFGGTDFWNAISRYTMMVKYSDVLKRKYEIESYLKELANNENCEHVNKTVGEIVGAILHGYEGNVSTDRQDIY